MNNNFFSGSRFWAWFKYDLRQMWQNHFKAALGIGFAGLIVYVIFVSWNLIFEGTWQGPGLGARIATFMLAGTILELYQTRTYGYLTDKRKGSSFLMLPASTFEKWLSMILMTLIVIPVIFLAASVSVDTLVCLLDPTVGDSMLKVLSDNFNSISESLVEVNGEIQEDFGFGLGIVTGPAIAAFCFNFLFFLLCGVCFKRYKILWAFVIIFAGSTLLSILGVTLDWNVNTDTVDTLRSFLGAFTWIVAGIAACFGAGIFLRLKALQH